jgi:hypothetical protein
MGIADELAFNELGDLVMKASLAMTQHKLLSELRRKPLLSFACALGVRSSDLSWLVHGSYTSYLSALIYCNQVILTYSILEKHRLADDAESAILEIELVMME